MADLCPKCNGLTWYEEDYGAVVQRCLCGLTNYIGMAREGEPSPPPREPKSRLPRQGSKLHRCLTAVLGHPPGGVSTTEVARESGCSKAAAAAQLMVLLDRGLVQKFEERRGRRGGSLWGASEGVTELLAMEV